MEENVIIKTLQSIVEKVTRPSILTIISIIVPIIGAIISLFRKNHEENKKFSEVLEDERTILLFDEFISPETGKPVLFRSTLDAQNSVTIRGFIKVKAVQCFPDEVVCEELDKRPEWFIKTTQGYKLTKFCWKNRKAIETAMQRYEDNQIKPLIEIMWENAKHHLGYIGTDQFIRCPNADYNVWNW